MSTASKQVQPSESSALPWVSSGVVAGLIGASAVALFFLVIDMIEGRPLWSPHALGSALFLGQRPDAQAAPQAVMVLAYTIAHGVVFIAFGVPAAFQVLARGEPMRRASAAIAVAVALFIGFEVVFFAFGELFLEGIIGALGVFRVSIGNALAAALMAAFLVWRARSQV